MNKQKNFISQLSVMIALLAAANFSVSADTLYRWVDEQGRVTFQDSPPIKQEFSKQELKSASGKIEQLQAQPIDITLFAIEACKACDLARQDLTDRGLRFIEINPQTNDDAGRSLLNRFGKVQVPLFYIGETVVKGYEPVWLDSELEKAGLGTVKELASD
ncbi:MAG: glutaredoxin family protein [Immundisolibacteraceae bacterium]|nr:glutaredoxin family protein [Immundisolibacteraceae bacterium]